MRVKIANPSIHELENVKNENKKLLQQVKDLKATVLKCTNFRKRYLVIKSLLMVKVVLALLKIVIHLLKSQIHFNPYLD